MTWDTFTKAIEESELVSGTPAKILIKLFDRAGYINRKEDGISESTAKKWIDGSRHCKVTSYFPDEENVQTQALYCFFKRRPQNKLEKLQEILSEKIDDNSPIDCTTKDMDRFCWGLVNQFLDLLGFQRIDLPAPDLPTDPTSILYTIENEIGENVVIKQDSSPLPSEIITQEEPRPITESAKIAIPQECKVCLCCVFWRGDAKAAYKNIENEYGECNALAKRVLAANGACAKFKESYGKIMRYNSYKKYGHYIEDHK